MKKDMQSNLSHVPDDPRTHNGVGLRKERAMLALVDRESQGTQAEREWSAVALESTQTGKNMGRDVPQLPNLDKGRRRGTYTQG